MFPFINLRPAFGLTLSDLFYMLSLILLLAKAFMTRKGINRRSVFHPFLLPSFFILCGGLLSTFSSYYPADSLKELSKMMFVFSLLPILVMSLVNESSVEKVLNAFLVGITFSSIVAIIDSSFGSSIGPTIAINSESTILYGSAGRYAGVAMHPNFQGIYIAVCLPLIAEFLNKHQKRLGLFLLYSVVFITCAYALILTGSLSSLLAAIVGLSIMFFVRSTASIGKRVVLVIAGGVILFAFLISVTSGTYDNTYKDVLSFAKSNRNVSRVLNITYFSRADANTFALRQIREDPIIGVGFDQASIDRYAPLDYSGKPSGVHNPLLRAWLGGGLFALLGYVILYFYTLRISLNVIFNFIGGRRKTWLLGLSGAVITFFIFDMAQPSTHMRITWLVSFILYTLIKRQKTQVPRFSINSSLLKKSSLEASDR